MYFSTSIAAVALTSLLSVVSAQTYYSVNPDDIDQGTKDTWCSNQVAACGALCLDQSSGEATVNSCDTETLVFSCLCADNKVPNATEYSQTIPYFLCTHSVQTCVNNCGLGSPSCAENCRTNRPCGATNPTRKNATSTATTATKTAGSRQTGTNGDDAPFDAATTGTDGRPINSDDDDAANGASTGSQKNGASALSSVPLNASAFTIMILSALCGAFVLQL